MTAATRNTDITNAVRLSQFHSPLRCNRKRKQNSPWLTMMLCADKQMLSSISAETKLFAGCHRSFVQHICTLCILTLVKEKKLQLLHAIRNTNIINTENYHKSITSHAMRQKNKILPPTMQGSNKNYHILSALSRCNHHGNLASTRPHNHCKIPGDHFTAGCF